MPLGIKLALLIGTFCCEMALFDTRQYHDADSFNEAVTHIGRHFSALHLNVRSIKNKVSDLSMFLDPRFLSCKIRCTFAFRDMARC